MENGSQTTWNNWNPGLDNDHLTLRQVKATLPGAAPSEINFLVRLIENPKSRVALTGAVSLERHDAIHILLGRGLLGQDEAFVIGFTMGTAKEELPPFQPFLFKKVARYLYPSPYRLTKKNLLAYELGLRAGKQSRARKIYEFPFEDYEDKSMAEIRGVLGIDTGYLRTAYREEQSLLPTTKASRRLSV